MRDNDETERLRARVRDLELALGQCTEGLTATFKLTPQLNRLLGLLVATPIVSSEIIQQRLEIAQHTKALISRLRAAMEPYGVKINTTRSVGYWISDEDKATIKKLVEARMEGINLDDFRVRPVEEAKQEASSETAAA